MIKTNEIVDELMSMPRPTRRRIQEILRVVWKDGRSNGLKKKK